MAAQPDPSARRRIEETEEVEKRGFAGAGRASDRDKLSPMHCEAGLLDQRHRDFPGETSGQPFRLDHRFGHCAPRRMSTGLTLAALRAGNRPALRAAAIAKAAA